MCRSVRVKFMYTDNRKHLKILTHVHSNTHKYKRTTNFPQTRITLSFTDSDCATFFWEGWVGVLTGNKSDLTVNPSIPSTKDAASVDVWLWAPVRMLELQLWRENQTQFGLWFRMEQLCNAASSSSPVQFIPTGYFKLPCYMKQTQEMNC